MARVPRSNVVQMPQAQPSEPPSETALAMAAAMMAQEGKLAPELESKDKPNGR